MEGRAVNALSFAAAARQPVPVMAMPALFLIVSVADDARVTDLNALPDLLRRSGLTDVDVRAATDGAVRFTFGGQAMTLMSGAGAGTALASERSPQDSAIGMAVPAAIPGPVLALQLAGEPAEGTAARAKALFRLAHVAAILVAVVPVEALYWPPAALWSPAAELASTVLAMERQGMPPVLPFVAFAPAQSTPPDQGALSTRGLAWIAGVELHVTGPAALGIGGLVARTARLALDAMLGGDMVSARTVPGLVRGESIGIAPDPVQPAIVAVTITGP